MGKIAVERNSNSDWLPPWTRLEHQARYDFAAGFAPGKRLVDCACGAGIGSHLFAEKGALEVHAIDSSSDAVIEARKTYSHPNLRITLGDATHIELPDECADVFISLETIEHLENDMDFIEEACRILKPGGIFICSTPNRKITNPGTSLTDNPWNPHHIREYDLEEFRARLEHRFEIQSVYGQNPTPSWRVRLMQQLARVLGTSWTVKINKLLKCRWFLWASPQHHAVRPASPDLPYEFYILVGLRPDRKAAIP